MSKWSKLKGAVLAATVLSALQFGGCAQDLIQDVLVGVIFD